jgi:hypothetical protein
LQNQRGVLNGYLRGQTDAARHAPQTVRYVNSALNPASWTLNVSANATLTPNQIDNEAGTNGVEGSQTSGAVNGVVFNGNAFNGSLAVGDWIYCGVWARSLGAFTPPLGSGGGNSVSCNTIGATGTTSVISNNPTAGDGEWEWNWQAYKITGLSGSPYVFNQGLFSTSNPQIFYSPVLFRIPAGTLSDGEVAQYVINVRGYSNACTVAQLCSATGVVPTSPNLAVSITAPTISSGFGTSPSIASSNGTAAFSVNVGTGGAASSGVITMPTAKTGWNCQVSPHGAPQAAAVTYSAPTSTTSITLTNYTLTTGATLAWTASLVFDVGCVGY